MATVTLRNFGLSFEAEVVGDRTSHDAVLKARQLQAQHYIPIEASVDAFSGLILFGFGNRGVNYFFRWAICGFPGSGPDATAQILSLFGFGAEDEIRQQVSLGGNAARYSFKRRA